VVKHKEIGPVNSELNVIKRIFKRALELNYVEEDPARNVKLLSMTRKNPRFLREKEVALILDDGVIFEQRRVASLAGLQE